MDVSLLPSRNEMSSLQDHRARIAEAMEEEQEIALTNIQRAQQAMKTVYDQSAREPTFAIGERVWLYTPKTKKGLSQKRMHYCHGPMP